MGEKGNIPRRKLLPFAKKLPRQRNGDGSKGPRRERERERDPPLIVCTYLPYFKKETKPSERKNDHTKQTKKQKRRKEGRK